MLTILGVCSIIVLCQEYAKYFHFYSIHNLVANRFLFKRGLLNLLNWRLLLKIVRLKILLYGIAFGYIHRKKTWKKKKKNKQISPLLITNYFLFD